MMNSIQSLRFRFSRNSKQTFISHFSIKPPNFVIHPGGLYHIIKSPLSHHVGLDLLLVWRIPQKANSLSSDTCVAHCYLTLMLSAGKSPAIKFGASTGLGCFNDTYEMLLNDHTNVVKRGAT